MFCSSLSSLGLLESFSTGMFPVPAAGQRGMKILIDSYSLLKASAWSDTCSSAHILLIKVGRIACLSSRWYGSIILPCDKRTRTEISVDFSSYHCLFYIIQVSLLTIKHCKEWVRYAIFLD